jgi:hypothetical protein
LCPGPTGLKVKVKFTLRLAVYRQSVRLGDKSLDAQDAIIIKQRIKHHERAKYRHNKIQATSVTIEGSTGDMSMAAIYCPPRYNNKHTDYSNFLKTLGNQFLVGGDLNAKNTIWGSRITTTKVRELQKLLKVKKR